MNLNIAVLTGGRSGERDRSLLSGTTVDAELRAMGHQTVIFDIADGSFSEHVKRFDLAFLAVAGEYGEDGRLQGCLDTLGVPYTGSGVFASAAGMDKMLFKSIARGKNIPVLADVAISPSEREEMIISKICDSLQFPVLLKPLADGCSNNLSVCHNLERLKWEIAQICRVHRTPFMAESFIDKAISLTVGVLEIEGNVKALPTLEIEPLGELYDAHSKRTTGGAKYHCPARIPERQLVIAQELAVRCHRMIGCRSHSRTDFVLRGEEIFVLEINTLPGLSKTGNLATMAAVDNISFRHLLQIIVINAINQ